MLEETVVDGVACVNFNSLAALADERGFLAETLEEGGSMGGIDLRAYLAEVEAHIARFQLIEYSSIIPGGWLVLSWGANEWSGALTRPATAPVEKTAGTCHDVIVYLQARL